MKKSMLGLTVAALFASAGHAQTATPVVQPPAPAVIGQVTTEAAAPKQAKVAKKQKASKTIKKAGKKGAKKAAASHAKQAPKLSATAKKHRKVQA